MLDYNLQSAVILPRTIKNIRCNKTILIYLTKLDRIDIGPQFTMVDFFVISVDRDITRLVSILCNFLQKPTALNKGCLLYIVCLCINMSIHKQYRYITVATLLFYYKRADATYC